MSARLVPRSPPGYRRRQMTSSCWMRWLRTWGSCGVLTLRPPPARHYWRVPPGRRTGGRHGGRGSTRGSAGSRRGHPRVGQARSSAPTMTSTGSPVMPKRGRSSACGRRSRPSRPGWPSRPRTPSPPSSARPARRARRARAGPRAIQPRPRDSKSSAVCSPCGGELGRVMAEREDKLVRVVDGGKRLAKARHNLDAAGLTVAQWQQQWACARWRIEANGCGDEPFGNLTITVAPNGEVSIRLPKPLEHLANAKRGRYVLTGRARFAYREQEWLARITGGKSVSYRITRRPRRAGVYLTAAWARAPETIDPDPETPACETPCWEVRDRSLPWTSTTATWRCGGWTSTAIRSACPSASTSTSRGRPPAGMPTSGTPSPG